MRECKPDRTAGHHITSCFVLFKHFFFFPRIYIISKHARGFSDWPHSEAFSDSSPRAPKMRSLVSSQHRNLSRQKPTHAPTNSASDAPGIRHQRNATRAKSMLTPILRSASATKRAGCVCSRQDSGEVRPAVARPLAGSVGRPAGQARVPPLSRHCSGFRPRHGHGWRDLEDLGSLA